MPRPTHLVGENPVAQQKAREEITIASVHAIEPATIREKWGRISLPHDAHATRFTCVTFHHVVVDGRHCFSGVGLLLVFPDADHLGCRLESVVPKPVGHSIPLLQPGLSGKSLEVDGRVGDNIGAGIISHTLFRN